MTSHGIERHYHEASQATLLGAGVMVSLAAAKLLVGWWGNSTALVADGLHTLSDLGSSVVVLVGLSIAKRPADRTHPYGHGRAEGIAARLVAFALLVVVAGILWHATRELGAAELRPPPHALVLVVAAASVAMKELLYRYKRRVSRQTGSQAVLADAWHHRSDALSSLPVFIGAGGAIIGGGRWVLLDPLAALVVAGFVLFAAAGILKQALPEMLDANIDQETIDRLKALARSIPGVRDVEATRGRRSGLGLLAELHVEVDPDVSVEEGHRVAQRVRDALLESEEHVTDAVIHIEPYYPNDHE